jgi:hypothetical protein
VAAPSGQVVFDLFLKIGFDAFHLTRAHGVRLPGGRALFSGCDTGLSAEAVLAGAGLRVSEILVLDAEHGVDMSVWRAVREPTLRRAKIGEQGRIRSVHLVAANHREGGVRSRREAPVAIAALNASIGRIRKL